MRPALAFFLLMSSTAYAAPMQAPAPKPQASAPKPKEVSSEDKLFAQLKAVESAEDAHPIEQKLMAMFRASGSPSVDLLITRVQAAMMATDKDDRQEADRCRHQHRAHLCRRLAHSRRPGACGG